MTSSRMRCTTKSLQVQYLAQFAAPCFDLIEKRSALLTKFHDFLREHKIVFFSSDVETIENGGALGDALIRVRLFGGNGLIEIRPAGVDANFTHAIQGDIPLIQNCVVGLVSAVESVLTNTALANEQMRFYPLVEFESPELRNKFLLSLSARESEFKSGHFPNARVWPAFKLEVDTEPDANFDVNIGRSWTDPKCLFVALNANFYKDAGSKLINERANVTAGLLVDLLKYLGLELVTAEELRKK